MSKEERQRREQDLELVQHRHAVVRASIQSIERAAPTVLEPIVVPTVEPMPQHASDERITQVAGFAAGRTVQSGLVDIDAARQAANRFAASAGELNVIPEAS